MFRALALLLMAWGAMVAPQVISVAAATPQPITPRNAGFSDQDVQEIEAMLRKRMKNPQLRLVRRPEPGHDRAELYEGNEFLGVVVVIDHEADPRGPRVYLT